MLVKNCAKCKRLIPYGSAYCPSCEAEIDAQRAKRKAENARRGALRRDPKYKRFYDSKPWRLLSAKRLSVDKHCAFCGKPAAEVDHIIEIQTPEGWAKRLDWSNTRSLCTVCHNKRHNRFQKRRTPGGGQKV